MEDFQLLLNSNSLCVICLSEVKAKVDKSDLFPLHHLTSKINSNLGDVFKNVTVPWAPNAVMDRLEVLADVCEGCSDLCEELLYKFQDDVGRENCIKSILDKMEGVGLEDKYKKCGSPVAVFYAGIVDRLRTDIMEKLQLKPELGERSNQSATGFPAGVQGIPNLLRIPDLPISQICSYLSFRDIRGCSIVSKELRRLVFPSFIKSSFIHFQNQSQTPAIIDFIKAVATNTKKSVNLSVKAEALDESSDGGRAILKLFQEYGSYINHLKVSFVFINSDKEEVNSFRNNSIPVLGKELFPNLKKLHIFYFYYPGKDAKYEDFDKIFYENLAVPSLPLIKSIFGNSPVLNQLKLEVFPSDFRITIPPSLFKLIGESGLPILIFEGECVHISGDGLGHLQALNLIKLVLDGGLGSKETQALKDFLESQGNTLKYAELYDWDFTFPRMEALETLKLHVYDVSGPFFNQTQLPNLKEIEFIGYHNDILETLLEEYAEPTRSVKELRLLLPSLDNKYLISLASVFECLSKLEVPVCSSLNEAWKDLSGLEELTLLPSSTGFGSSWEKTTWIDDIITGLEITLGCLGILTDGDIQRCEEEYEKMEGKKSLALLKRLRLFRIRHEVWYEHGQRLMLSDIACRLVLIKMESLKCIDFCGIHPSFVGASRKVLDEMGKKMDLYFGQERDWEYEPSEIKRIS